MSDYIFSPLEFYDKVYLVTKEVDESAELSACIYHYLYLTENSDTLIEKLNALLLSECMRENVIEALSYFGDDEKVIKKIISSCSKHISFSKLIKNPFYVENLAHFFKYFDKKVTLPVFIKMVPKLTSYTVEQLRAFVYIIPDISGRYLKRFLDMINLSDLEHLTITDILEVFSANYCRGFYYPGILKTIILLLHRSFGVEGLSYILSFRDDTIVFITNNFCKEEMKFLSESKKDGILRNIYEELIKLKKQKCNHTEKISFEDFDVNTCKHQISTDIQYDCSHYHKMVCYLHSMNKFPIMHSDIRDNMPEDRKNLEWCARAYIKDRDVIWLQALKFLTTNPYAKIAAAREYVLSGKRINEITEYFTVALLFDNCIEESMIEALNNNKGKIDYRYIRNFVVHDEGPLTTYLKLFPKIDLDVFLHLCGEDFVNLTLEMYEIYITQRPDGVLDEQILTVFANKFQNLITQNVINAYKQYSPKVDRNSLELLFIMSK